MLYCIAAPLGRGSCWHKLCLVLLLPKGANVSCSCRYSQKEAWQGWPNMVMLWVFWCVFFNQCKRRGSKSTPQIGTVKPAAKSVNQMFLYIFIYFNCWLQSKHNTICCARCAVCQMSELMVRLESSCRQVEQLYYCGPQTRPWLFLGCFFWSLWGNFRNSPSVSFLTLHSRNVLVLKLPGENQTWILKEKCADSSKLSSLSKGRCFTGTSCAGEWAKKSAPVWCTYIISLLSPTSVHLPLHRG